MYHIQERSLEWALLHLVNYYDSDFFPRLFEFEAIKQDWDNIKKALLKVDLEKYAPKSPLIFLAPKPNSNYRVVHQLDPIDSLIYTALLYENADVIENYRIPESRKIACSYRIETNTTGSFFEADYTGYPEFMAKSENLADEFEDGVVLVCDIIDFYNQIYLHRVNNVLSEAGSKAAKVIENFLGGLNTNVSRGIPVGPAPSILIAEAIMSDINKKILSYTDSFAQYVDDIFIFFEDEYKAKIFLHELTKYLYSNHRLVLSPEKTKVIQIDVFRRDYLKEESRVEKDAIRAKLNEISHYPSVDETTDFESLKGEDKVKIRAETYVKLLADALKIDKFELGLIRHIFRQAGRYRIKKIIPQVFNHFDQLLPAIREVVIYLDKVLDDAIVRTYRLKFLKVLENPFLEIPFINIWIFTLFQNKHFNSISLRIDYSKILRVREKALIAKRENNLTYIKDIKDGLDTLGNWDRRAVLYSGIILSEDEVKHWLGLEASKDDIVNKAICSLVINKKKSTR